LPLTSLGSSDPYVAAILAQLQGVQAVQPQAGVGGGDSHQYTAHLGAQPTSTPSPTHAVGSLGQAGFGATPVGYSWQNLQVYLANAAGKSSEFLDICDFVAAQGQVATEEVLVQKEGRPHLVLKSG
jgi:hypothetical protein